MNEDMYLLDTNVLSHLSETHRSSAFFLTRCRVPSDVLYEARWHPPAEYEVEYLTTARVLTHLQRVMLCVPVGDPTLVNLYANKGTADPMLVACALDATEDSSAVLFGPEWVIVSNDIAVRRTAAHFHIRTLAREEFLAHVQDSWHDAS
ncbi:hypothetical protein [Microbacterium phyllosphaerae]|uniref:hypothetical protein n=1 Tax=Microbacterium phyllosphaerae TaxID=124798 RepID=UPI003D654ABC